MADAVDNLQLQGPMRRRALEQFHRQIQQWEIALPPAQLLVLDFGLDEFAQTGLIESWIANESAAGYCGKYLFVFAGQQCPRHRHQVKHETFFPVRGALRVHLEGRDLDLPAGQTLAIPPGQLHGFAGVGNALLLELSMPCDVADNHFQDPRIDRWLKRCLG